MAKPHQVWTVLPHGKLREVKDEEALSVQLERWADLPNLQRVIISHGDIISHGPGAVLRRISAELRA